MRSDIRICGKYDCDFATFVLAGFCKRILVAKRFVPQCSAALFAINTRYPLIVLRHLFRIRRDF